MMDATARQGSWSRWHLAVAVFAIAAVAVLALFWGTAVSMEEIWRGNDSYQHTYLVPLILA